MDKDYHLTEIISSTLLTEDSTAHCNVKIADGEIKNGLPRTVLAPTMFNMCTND